MKILILAACALLLPSTALAVTPNVVGVGANGYDWLVGSWACTNAAAATIGGPSAQTVTVSRNAAGGLSLRVTAGVFERSGYVAYVPATKTWWTSVAYPNGNYYAESTRQSGSKTVWSGPYTDVASGKTFSVRDTYTVVSPTRYEDVGEYESGGSWKTGYRGVCNKSSS